MILLILTWNQNVLGSHSLPYVPAHNPTMNYLPFSLSVGTIGLVCTNQT